MIVSAAETAGNTRINIDSQSIFRCFFCELSSSLTSTIWRTIKGEFPVELLYDRRLALCTYENIKHFYAAEYNRNVLLFSLSLDFIMNRFDKSHK